MQDAAEKAKAWLCDSALPLWGDAGVDDAGAFHERLDFSGQPDRACPRRMRVQARQTYVFAEAAVNGWSTAAPGLAEFGLEALLRRCWAADGAPGFVHVLGPDLTPRDGKRDAYDHAFGLFGALWAYKALGEQRALGLARDTLAFMDQTLGDPLHGGYQESAPPALPRRSNPQMHTLEACLAGLAFTGEDIFAKRAATLIDLFVTRFFDRETGTYGEYFTDDWRPQPGAGGQVIEPGHHCEWVWLLAWADALGLEGGEPFIEPLYDWVMAHGLDTQGFAIDECDRQGRPVRTTRRAWVQTELIKAHVALARRGRPGAAERAAEVVEGFLATYLATEIPGLWMDQFDAAGAGLDAWAPASSLYHIQVAFREMILLAEGA